VCEASFPRGRIRDALRANSGVTSNAYVESIYAYSKTHSISAVRFQFEISDTYVLPDRKLTGCGLKGSFAITSM
jgi:hypothetical protein